MGLDITVHKLKKANDASLEEDRFFRLVNDDGEYNDKPFPSWAKKFITKKEEEWYDWEKLKKEKNFDLEQWACKAETYDDDDDDILVFENDDTKEEIKIKIDEIPTYTKVISIIGYEEVGYQRKGLNDNFYKDYNNGKIGYFVWDMKQLERYCKDYCDTDEDKENFKKNIIDKFIEGECCVTFDW